VSTTAELTAIAANDVASISLAARDPGPFPSDRQRAGNPILAVSDYRRTGGTTAEAIATAFVTDATNTRFVTPDGFAYDPEVYALPNLRGYGSMPDLWTAMSLDAELKAMVKALIADVADYSSILDMLFRWTGNNCLGSWSGCAEPLCAANDDDLEASVAA
jgi:hypothetical protein